MNIDDRDFKKGLLEENVPDFYPDSISYLRELNEYRMYAEIWSNNRNTAWQKRKEIGHEGYLKTLAMGETVKRRKIDKIRFGSFVVADSVNYSVRAGDNCPHITLGCTRHNMIFNNIVNKNRHLLKLQSKFPGTDFHAEEFIPGLLEINLLNLKLKHDTEENKHFFEIPTNSTEIPNDNQKKILFHVFGEDAISKKFPLLYKSNRKAIRFLFESPANLKKNNNTRNTTSRSCVARPFDETIVIDFAATLEDQEETYILGTLLKQEDQADKMKWYEKIISNT